MTKGLAMKKAVIIACAIFQALGLRSVGVELKKPANVVQVTAGAPLIWLSSYKRKELTEQWNFYITEVTLEKLPVWAKDEPYPPLSPRRAIEVAQSMIPKLTPDATIRELELISLHRPQHHVLPDFWIYVVEYRVCRNRSRSGPFQPVHVLVLMDGTPVIPRITSPQRPDIEIRKVSL